MKQLTKEELQEIKIADIELYLILRYGSLHEGFIAWSEIYESNKTIEEFFDFLDFFIDFQSRTR